MNNTVRLQLQTSASQSARLAELQQAFAQVCNALAPLAQKTGCWNRVALHHMAYKGLRAQFPGLGSQMVCNAIYSVSRACRHVYQHPSSPFNLQRMAGKPLPQIKFLPQAPVYFDRHTLSLKDGQVSMFTLDGRMRFNLALTDTDAQRFRNDKLREIVLTGHADKFFLAFMFGAKDEASESGNSGEARVSNDADSQVASPSPGQSAAPDLPEYMLVIEDGVPDQDAIPPPPMFPDPPVQPLQPTTTRPTTQASV